MLGETSYDYILMSRISVSRACLIFYQLALILWSTLGLFLACQSIKKSFLSSRLEHRDQNLPLPIPKKPFPTPSEVRRSRRETKSKQKLLSKDPRYIAALRWSEQSRPAVFAIFNRNNRTVEVSKSKWRAHQKLHRLAGATKSPLRACFVPDRAHSAMDDCQTLVLAGCDDDNQEDQISALSAAGGDSEMTVKDIGPLLLAQRDTIPVPKVRIEEINLPSIWPSNPSLKNSFIRLLIWNQDILVPITRQTTIQFFLILLRSNGRYRSCKRSPHSGPLMSKARILLKQLVGHGIYVCNFALVQTAADFQTLLVFVDQKRFPKLRGLSKENPYRFSIRESGRRRK